MGKQEESPLPSVPMAENQWFAGAKMWELFLCVFPPVKRRTPTAPAGIVTGLTGNQTSKLSLVARGFALCVRIPRKPNCFSCSLPLGRKILCKTGRIPGEITTPASAWQKNVWEPGSVSIFCLHPYSGGRAAPQPLGEFLAESPLGRPGSA